MCSHSSVQKEMIHFMKLHGGTPCIFIWLAPNNPCKKKNIDFYCDFRDLESGWLIVIYLVEESLYLTGEIRRMSIAVAFLVAIILRRTGEGFDETEIHSFGKARTCCIDGLLPIGIVRCLANHWEDFQHLTIDNQLLCQLAVIWVEHVVDNHKATVLYSNVSVETQPLQDLKPLGGLLGKINQSVSDTEMCEWWIENDTCCN